LRHIPKFLSRISDDPWSLKSSLGIAD